MAKTGAKLSNKSEPLKERKGRRLPGYRMLSVLIRAFGGSAQVARMVGESKQTVNEWRSRGLVPLKKVRKVADAFDVPVYVLNWADVKLFMPEATPPWKKAVAEAPISEEMKQWVLKAGEFSEP